MALTTVAKGRRAEEAAGDYLRSHGWEVLSRNHRTPVGELDLVCLDDDCLVVVEVKARSGCSFGDALEAVGPRKARRLRAATAWWMAERGRVAGRVRFDVVAVALQDDGSLMSLSHLRDVLGHG